MKKYLKTFVTIVVWSVLCVTLLNLNVDAETDRANELITNGNVVSISEDGYALVDYKDMNIITKVNRPVRIFPYAQDKVVVDNLDNCIGTGFSNIEPSQYYTKVGSLIPMGDSLLDAAVESLYTDVEHGYVFYVNLKGYICAQKFVECRLSDKGYAYYEPSSKTAYIAN